MDMEHNKTCHRLTAGVKKILSLSLSFFLFIQITVLKNHLFENFQDQRKMENCFLKQECLALKPLRWQTTTGARGMS